MHIYNSLSLDKLFREAADSPRKRAHKNLHNSYSDKVQRLLISMTKGSYVEPHYHELEHQWEVFVVLDGLLEIKIYADDGSLIDSLLVGDDQQVKMIEFLPRDIHSVKCLSDNALVLEFKEGPFDSTCAKVFPKWHG